MRALQIAICLLALYTLCDTYNAGPNGTFYVPFSLTFRTTAFYPPGKSGLAYQSGYALGQQMSTNIGMQPSGLGFDDYWAAGSNEGPAFYHTTFECCSGPTNNYHEFGTIDFQNGNVLNISGYEASGYFGATPPNFQGSTFVNVFNVTGGTGLFSDAFGTCSYVSATPYDQCSFGIRIQCGVWVYKNPANTDSEYLSEKVKIDSNVLRTQEDLAKHSIQLPGEPHYMPFLVGEDDPVNLPPNTHFLVPGPGNTTRIEFNLVFTVTALYPPTGPAKNVGSSASQELITDLTNPGGPTFTIKTLSGKTNATWNSDIVVLPPYLQWSENGTMSFGNGNTINLMSIGESGYFKNNKVTWNGSYGAAAFNVVGGTGIFKNASGVVATMFQTPNNPNTFLRNAWGIFFVPSSQIKGTKPSPNIQGKPC